MLPDDYPKNTSKSTENDVNQNERQNNNHDNLNHQENQKANEDINNKASKKLDESLTSSSSSDIDTSREEVSSNQEEREKKTVYLSEKRALLQKDYYEENDLPKPKSVKPEDIQEILDVYDLPAFPKKKKMGQSTVFTDDEEQRMMEYLHVAVNMGIGRTMEQFQADILFYYSKTERKTEKKTIDKKTKGHVFGKINFFNNGHF